MADSFKAAYDGKTWYLILEAYTPSKYEIESVDPATPLEIRFTTINNVIMFSLKYPGEAPIDAPFTPHWYDPKPFVISPPTANMGYVMQYMLIPHGKTRLIGLGYKFSRALYNAVIAAYNAPYNTAIHMQNIHKIYNQNTPLQLWGLAPADQRYVVGTSEPSPAPGNIPDNISIDELCHTQGEYIPDTGAICIYCVLECHRDAAQGRTQDFIVPIPVEYLREKGYTVENGVVYTDAPYDNMLGVVIDEKYYK